MRYCGLLYRALNPVYASEPLSGRGAQHYGGRFNAKGTPALYLSVSIMTALREANQAGSRQPTTLVSYDADIRSIFDARDDEALRSEDMDASGLRDPGWRDEMRLNGIARTQAFAARLAVRYDGLLVRSFAPGAGREDLNMVLWRWTDPSSRLTPVDDESRLSRLRHPTERA